MKKKLVQINVVCNGSTGRIMNQIQQNAIENGWEAYSFFGRGKPANKNCYKISNKFEVLWSVFLTRVFGKHGCGCKIATKKLIKKIKEINPDVIQLHNIHGYYLNISMLFDYLRKCNKKIIWTLHDCWAFTGHCAYFTMANCNRWQTQCENCIQKNTYPESKLIDYSKKEFQKKKELFTNIENLTIVTPSGWLAKLVKKSFLGNYDIKVINNGIDLNVFKPTTTIDVREKYNIPKEKNIILGVAAIWDRRKGLDEFIELAKHIDEKQQIVLIGLNKGQIKKLPQNILGIERTENVEELANLYTSATVLFNPSKEETFSLVTIEAMACGTPVIAYDNSAVKELINKENGLCLKLKNNLEKNIQLILNYIENVEKIRDSNINKYSIKIMTKEYINLYGINEKKPINEEDKSDYDILFIGGVYEENSEQEYLEKSKIGIQNAVNTHQWNFIKGIDANNKRPVNILSARYVHAYPNYKDIYVKKNAWSHIIGANDENIGFLNIKIIKNIERKLKLQHKAKKWAKTKGASSKVIVCYSASIPQMEATIKAKKKNKNIKTILIIPDIPQFMNLQDKISNIKKKISAKIEKKQNTLVQQFDGFVLLTKDMAYPLGIQEKPKVVIEGIINVEDKSNEDIQKRHENATKNIVYTGSLHKKYGMENYIEAIKLIDDKNINFYIFGSGEMEKDIVELAKKDTRIKFMGYKTRKEILEFQRNATLLINPRNLNEEFVKYSFPSKLIEYMLSGTPVLTSKLPSIPQEYFPFLFFVDGDVTKESLKKAIVNVINLDKNILNEKGKKAKEFVIENKNYIVQGKKVVELIKKIV